MLERLHEVRLDRFLHEHRHRTLRVERLGADRLVVAAIADDDLLEAVAHVVERRRQAQDRHDLRRGHDVVARLAREAVPRAAKAVHDVPQAAVVHVEHTAPCRAADVEAELIAEVNVVVDERREQVVRDAHRVEVAGEMEVDVLHGRNLRMTAACAAALHAEARPERWLSHADHGLLADRVQRIAEADGRRGLAFARGCRGDRGDEDELAVLTRLQTLDQPRRQLGFVVTIRLEIVGIDAEAFFRELYDFSQLHAASNGDIVFHGSTHRANSREENPAAQRARPGFV